MAKMTLYEVPIPPNLQIDQLGEISAFRSGGKLQIQAHGYTDQEIKDTMKIMSDNILLAAGLRP